MSSRRSGCCPFGDKDTWFENFDFTAGVALGEGNALTLWQAARTATELDGGQGWRPLSFSRRARSRQAGSSSPATASRRPRSALGADGKKIEPYSSYVHLDVKDKWVLVLRYLPEGITPGAAQ